MEQRLKKKLRGHQNSMTGKLKLLVMGDTEYWVIDTTSSGISIDYWLSIVRYLHPFFLHDFNFLAFFVKTI